MPVCTSPIAEEAPVMTTTLFSMLSLLNVLKNHSRAWMKESVGHAKASITILAGGTTKFRMLSTRSIDWYRCCCSDEEDTISRPHRRDKKRGQRERESEALRDIEFWWQRDVGSWRMWGMHTHVVLGGRADCDECITILAPLQFLFRRWRSCRLVLIQTY